MPGRPMTRHQPSRVPPRAGSFTAAFGRRVMRKVPGAGEIMIYEPRHPTAYDLEG